MNVIDLTPVIKRRWYVSVNGERIDQDFSDWDLQDVVKFAVNIKQATLVDVEIDYGYMSCGEIVSDFYLAVHDDG